MKNNQTTFESTLKSKDTEEFIDIYFYRPIGYRWALLFKKLGVTPNAVTIASIFLGIGAGICFYFNNIWVSVLGIFLLVWANSYDSADGQLARMTKQFSVLGRILDGFAGNLWFASIYVAIALRLYPEWDGWIWILAFVTGYFHSKQAEMADYYRNIHLLFLKGKAGSELENSKELTNQFEQLSWEKNFGKKLVLFFYRNYTSDQEHRSPKFQRLFRLLKENFGDIPPQSFCEDFREKSLPLMKYTNILSFNTRSITLFITLLIGYPWLYFLFELTVLNILLVYMTVRHERICKQFIIDIEKGVYK
jgi:hypothetical protein